MYKKKLTLIFYLTAILMLPITGCYYDKDLLPSGETIDCSTINAKFSTNVKPLIQSKCATSGCHDSAPGSSGIIFETYSQIASRAGKINQRCVIEKSMPPGAPLSASEISILKCWISSGAPNN